MPTNRLTCVLGLFVLIAMYGVGEAAKPADVNHGLILYYSFDQDAEYVEDLSGHGRHGVINGATWVPDGVLGGAMYLVGPQHSIETSDAGFPEGDAPRSFSWWFALDELAPAFSTDFMYYGTLRHNQANALAIDWRHGRNCPAFSQWGGVYLSGRRIDRIRTWYHLVFIYRGNGLFSYYVNGERWHGMSELRGALNTVLGGTFAIGSHTPDSVNSIGGFIDEVRVYDRVLTDDEVRYLYSQGAESAGQSVASRSVRVADAASMAAEHTASQGYSEVGLNESLVNAIRSAQHSASSSHGLVKASEYFDSTPHVLTVGFSDHAEGDRDVTFFYPDETLHVWVADVDLALWYPHLAFSLTLHQLADDAETSVAEIILLEEDESHVFYGEVSLTSFQTGTVLVNLIALDEEAERIVFMRSAWIIIKDAP